MALGDYSAHNNTVYNNNITLLGYLYYVKITGYNLLNEPNICF